jgi:hypothetical protein
MLIKSDFVHIDTADNITMACEATCAACPISALGLVFVPTDRTLAACASFGASEAHDVGLFGFVREVVDILAIFPQGHALIVVTTRISLTYSMRIADEKRADLMLPTEVDHQARGFVPQITDPTLCSRLDLVLGTLQLSPSARMRGASGLLLCDLAQLLASLSFQRSDAASRYDHGLARVSRNRCQVDFTQVNRCMNRSRCIFSLRSLGTDMQLKTVLPDKTTRTTVFRQVERQDKRLASFAHGKDHSPIFFAHSLSRPLDRIEAFFSPGIFHLHLWMRLTDFACSIDVAKKGMDDHLHRLAMQSKLVLCGFLQFEASRPFGMAHSGLLVDLATEIPDFSGLHLSISQASKQFWGGFQSIHTHGIHAIILAWKQIGCKWVKPDGAITRSGTTWFGSPNIAEKSLREQLKQRRKSSLQNAVSNTISHF